MSTTPNIGLVRLEVGQAGKEATINENYDKLDASVGSPFGARVYHNAVQSIPNATATAINFNSERFDTNVIHDTATNNSRLTCKTAGTYAITGCLGFATNATGYRQVLIRLNGTTYIAASSSDAVSVGGDTFHIVSAIYGLAVNDYVELIGYHTAGGSLNTSAAASYSPEFSMVRVVSGGAGSGDVIGPASASDNAIARFDTTSGKLVQASVVTIDDTGLVSFPDNIRQTFNPGAANAGLNVGSYPGDPSAPANGDIWYDSTANTLDARINGATVNLGAGGGGGGDVTAGSNFGTDNRIVRSDGTLKGVQSSAISIDDSGNITGVNSIAVGDGTVAGESKLFELTANGSNYISHLAPDSITNTLRLKFPNADPTAGQALVYGAPSSNVSTGAWVTVGYLEVPSNSQSANYTLVLADSGKSIDHPASDANARTFTIPANASVAFPVGTAVSFSNMTSQVVSIAITSDTMYLAGAGSTGTRSLAQFGTATARKLTSTTWLISGVGLT